MPNDLLNLDQIYQISFLQTSIDQFDDFNSKIHEKASKINSRFINSSDSIFPDYCNEVNPLLNLQILIHWIKSNKKTILLKSRRLIFQIQIIKLIKVHQKSLVPEINLDSISKLISSNLSHLPG
jgi:hypothetical protein